MGFRYGSGFVMVLTSKDLNVGWISWKWLLFFVGFQRAHDGVFKGFLTFKLKGRLQWVKYYHMIWSEWYGPHSMVYMTWSIWYGHLGKRRFPNFFHENFKLFKKQFSCSFYREGICWVLNVRILSLERSTHFDLNRCSLLASLSSNFRYN